MDKLTDEEIRARARVREHYSKICDFLAANWAKGGYERIKAINPSVYSHFISTDNELGQVWEMMERGGATAQYVLRVIRKWTDAHMAIIDTLAVYDGGMKKLAEELVHEGR